jgi:hypothetical protein
MWRLALKSEVGPLAIPRSFDFAASMKRLSYFEISLTVQVFGFDVTCAVGITGGENNNVRWNLFLVVQAYKVTDLHALPVFLLEPCGFWRVLGVVHQTSVELLDWGLLGRRFTRGRYRKSLGCISGLGGIIVKIAHHLAVFEILLVSVLLLIGSRRWNWRHFHLAGLSLSYWFFVIIERTGPNTVSPIIL